MKANRLGSGLMWPRVVARAGMRTVVRRSMVWSLRRIVLTAAFVAATSLGAFWILDRVNTAMDWEMHDLVFFPIFLTVTLVYPAGSLVGYYERMPRVKHAFCYGLSFGASWYLTMFLLQVAEYGLWKGFLPWEQTPSSLLRREITYLTVVTAIAVSFFVIVWGGCRLVRGKVIIEDEGKCSGCGYDLRGNVSGICPECGVKVEVTPPRRVAGG